MGWDMSQGTVNYIVVQFWSSSAILSQCFLPIMHFQLDCSSLLLFCRQQHYDSNWITWAFLIFYCYLPACCSSLGRGMHSLIIIVITIIIIITYRFIWVFYIAACRDCHPVETFSCCWTVMSIRLCTESGSRDTIQCKMFNLFSKNDREP